MVHTSFSDKARKKKLRHAATTEKNFRAMRKRDLVRRALQLEIETSLFRHESIQRVIKNCDEESVAYLLHLALLDAVRELSAYTREPVDALYGRLTKFDGYWSSVFAQYNAKYFNNDSDAL